MPPRLSPTCGTGCRLLDRSSPTGGTVAPPPSTYPGNSRFSVATAGTPAASPWTRR